jgi:hypothetical protein
MYVHLHALYSLELNAGDDQLHAPSTLPQGQFVFRFFLGFKISVLPCLIFTLSWTFFRPPLWSSGQSSWLQIRRPGFHSRHYQKKSSGSGTGSTQPREYNCGATWKKSSGSCLENREYGRRDRSRLPRGTLYPQKLAITSPTSGGRSVGRVCSRTQTMESVCLFVWTFFLCPFCSFLSWPVITDLNTTNSRHLYTANTRPISSTIILYTLDYNYLEVLCLNLIGWNSLNVLVSLI